MTEYAFEPARRDSASIGWSFATQNFAADAATPFSGAIGGGYQAVVAAAFARWSAVSGLVFTQQADAATVPIRIGFGVFASSSELGETDFRYGNGIIADDTIIRLLDPTVAPVAATAAGYSYAQYGVTLLQVALHEIGHALGLDHSGDPATVMYPYATARNTDLAVGDIEGINTLYPFFTVTAANPLQTEGGPGQVDQFDFVVTRHGDPAVPLVVNYAVTGVSDPAVPFSLPAGADSFVGGALPTGQLAFAAGSATATLSVRTIGNATPQADRGFAVGLSTGDPLDSVTVRGTVVAAVLDDDDAPDRGTLAVFRFFDTVSGTQFLTPSISERNGLLQTRPDLTYEGQGLRAVASPATDPAAAPVFRFFDTGNGTHFYTATAAEAAALRASRPDLVAENVGFYEHVTAQPGDAAVYRFFDMRDGTHFYTSNASERASVLATRPDLRDEGIAFYAPAA